MATERSSKRRKTAADSTTSVDTEVLDSEQQTVVTQRLPSESLNRPISPPLSSRTRSRRGAEGHTPPRADEENVKKTAPRDPPKQVDEEDVKKGEELQPETTPEEQDSKSDQYLPPQVQFLASPVQLTRIKDFHSTQNVDTVGLGDILGDPLIKEVWNFNYLFDIDFVM
jgi:tyrosyl-DNA phosphodiesterase-1